MSNPGRWVIHIDMDAFFASCEQLTRPTLRGRPVVVGGMSGRGVVAGASYEARARGAFSAMPTSQAKSLIGPTGIVVRPRFAVYKAVSQRVMAIFAQAAGEGLEDAGPIVVSGDSDDRPPLGVIEQLSVDEAFLEPQCLVGATPQQVRAWAEKVRAQVKEETGLIASVGAGSGKQYAKIASGLAKPDGITVIAHEIEHRIIDPLPVRKLWGVGPVAESKLAEIGVKTVGELAAMSQGDVEMVLGRAVGYHLWQLARGNDNRPVMPRAAAKSVSAERTLEQDISTSPELRAVVDNVFEMAYRRLKNDARGAKTVTLKTKTADFQTRTRSVTLSSPTNDHEVLRQVAMGIAASYQIAEPLRLVGVGFSGLESSWQESLFDDGEALGAEAAAVVAARVEESSEDGIESDVVLAATSTISGVGGAGLGSGLPQQSGNLGGSQPSESVHGSDLPQQSELAVSGQVSNDSSPAAVEPDRDLLDEIPTPGQVASIPLAERVNSETGALSPHDAPTERAASADIKWEAGMDVEHPEYGFGWVQGAGHGVVTVRFETRLTGPGTVRTFRLGEAQLTVADPLRSLDWGEYFATNEVEDDQDPHLDPERLFQIES